MTETPASATTTRTTTTTESRSTRDKVAAATHAILRIGAGLLFMQHGAQKLFGLLGGFGEAGGTAELFSLMGLAGVLEFFGGAMIVLGLLTMPVAAILFIEMIAAYFMAHMPQGGFPIQNGGEPALLFAIIFLYLAANGSGPFAVDRRIAMSRTER